MWQNDFAIENYVQYTCIYIYNYSYIHKLQVGSFAGRWRTVPKNNLKRQLQRWVCGKTSQRSSFGRFPTISIAPTVKNGKRCGEIALPRLLPHVSMIRRRFNDVSSLFSEYLPFYANARLFIVEFHSNSHLHSHTCPLCALLYACALSCVSFDVFVTFSCMMQP